MASPIEVFDDWMLALSAAMLRMCMMIKHSKHCCVAQAGWWYIHYTNRPNNDARWENVHSTVHFWIHTEKCLCIILSVKMWTIVTFHTKKNCLMVNWIGRTDLLLNQIDQTHFEAQLKRTIYSCLNSIHSSHSLTSPTISHHTRPKRYNKMCRAQCVLWKWF